MSAEWDAFEDRVVALGMSDRKEMEVLRAARDLIEGFCSRKGGICVLKIPVRERHDDWEMPPGV